jgi:hypothetical protein
LRGVFAVRSIWSTLSSEAEGGVVHPISIGKTQARRMPAEAARSRFPRGGPA